MPQRTRSFPTEMDEAGITATADDGTLEVRLPIAAEERDGWRAIAIDD